jgi:methyl-accepting chemotaxis protein
MLKFFGLKKKEKGNFQEQDYLLKLKAFLRYKSQVSNHSSSLESFPESAQKIKDALFQSGDQISLSLLKFPEKLKEVNEFREDFSRSMAEIAMESKNLAANAEELDAVMHNLKDNISSAKEIAVNTSKSSQKVVNTASESNLSIQKTAEMSESIVKDNESQLVELKEMVHLVKNINDQIQLVREISDQTNLLSLNASIEAARAGAQGAGFAVVAEGVSKLADKSKMAVQTIEKSVNAIQKEFQKWMNNSKLRIELILSAGEAIQKTKSNVNSNKLLAEESLEMMGRMENIFDEISIMIEEIKSTSERVASSSIEMSQTIETLDQKDQIVKENIESIHYQIEESTKDITNQNAVWLLQFIQARRSDHIIWVEKVRECIDKKTVTGFPEIRHTHCKMGTWFYQSVVIDSKQKLIHERLEIPHLNLHKAGANILELIQNGDFLRIESEWKELDKYYREIAVIFDEYQSFLEAKALKSFVRQE